jgi:acetyltransferase-like isoleucine patch superfamily enzyme
MCNVSNNLLYPHNDGYCDELIEFFMRLHLYNNVKANILFIIRKFIGQFVVSLMFYGGRLYCKIKGVKYGSNLRTIGIPLIYRHKEASIILEDDVVLNSSPKFNLAGINHPVILAAVKKNSRIYIGSGSGMSGAVIHARTLIQIDRYVNIGANTKIYDHDFHSLDYQERRDNLLDNVRTDAIFIEDDVWIGADSLILKGVRIGRGAIIGAGSVVTKDIPPFTIWAGNPAKFIRDIS